jgi:hypothetical protein
MGDDDHHGAHGDKAVDPGEDRLPRAAPMIAGASARIASRAPTARWKRSRAVGEGSGIGWIILWLTR